MTSAVVWAIRRMSLLGVSVRLAVDDTMKHHSMVAYVSALKGKYLIVHSIDRRTGASKTFVCNERSWEAQKVLGEYSYRWMIEEFFGNAKGLCHLEEACIRSEQGGALALFLVSYTAM